MPRIDEFTRENGEPSLIAERDGANVDLVFAPRFREYATPVRLTSDDVLAVELSNVSSDGGGRAIATFWPVVRRATGRHVLGSFGFDTDANDDAMMLRGLQRVLREAAAAAGCAFDPSCTTTEGKPFAPPPAPTPLTRDVLLAEIARALDLAFPDRARLLTNELDRWIHRT